MLGSPAAVRATFAGLEYSSPSTERFADSYASEKEHYLLVCQQRPQPLCRPRLSVARSAIFNLPPALDKSSKFNNI